MNGILEIILSVLVLIGALLVLLGSIGLVKLPDFYTRLHAPTKATTLGLGCLLIASMIIHTAANGSLSVHELLITVFLFITAPITAHMLAKSALHLELDIAKGTTNRCPEDVVKKSV
ncbi:Na+/H+ antiporter subunit G [Neptuniibacter sp. CAU 1671]|jgi:multicomponent K+:H+ antiporter subunit G|uniref:Na+/H+ antiporter subunit G n=1 Tax=Neptuniibacter sp. CAU 1671 TaxID=3032593 RepID=UPI0023DA41DB|nr:Na+/H+ antiporter subunit G [Neptuniibacter sp. CAU 1671]MDF2180961.1 Na+/H+ antiporter subunit G [Neptuniibacter sp. CAU 1671]